MTTYVVSALSHFFSLFLPKVSIYHVASTYSDWLVHSRYHQNLVNKESCLQALMEKCVVFKTLRGTSGLTKYLIYKQGKEERQKEIGTIIKQRNFTNHHFGGFFYSS